MARIKSTKDFNQSLWSNPLESMNYHISWMNLTQSSQLVVGERRIQQISDAEWEKTDQVTNFTDCLADSQLKLFASL